jgi:hypothetical protein
MAESDELALMEASASERVGQILAERYRLDALLGIGGMGAVYKGFHLGLRRPVAIKLLHPALARDAHISKRFDREAHSVSRLEHPNCVQVTDFGTTEDGTKYLVMQYLEGHELERLLEREAAMPFARATALILQILHGLAHAHRQGVAHRDLKPENVFVTTDHEGRETLKLVDFGISKITSGPGSDKLTRAGLVFGTPDYMSPEQALGQASDHRADIYAAGILFFRMLTGTLPFTADDPVSLIRMQVTQPLPALPASVPAHLSAIVERMTAKSADERIGSAEEVIAALETSGLPSPLASAGAEIGPASTVVTERTAAPEGAALARQAVPSIPLTLPTPVETHAVPRVRRRGLVAFAAGWLVVMAAGFAWLQLSASTQPVGIFRIPNPEADRAASVQELGGDASGPIAGTRAESNAAVLAGGAAETAPAGSAKRDPLVAQTNRARPRARRTAKASARSRARSAGADSAFS